MFKQQRAGLLGENCSANMRLMLKIGRPLFSNLVSMCTFLYLMAWLCNNCIHDNFLFVLQHVLLKYQLKTNIGICLSIAPRIEGLWIVCFIPIQEPIYQSQHIHNLKRHPFCLLIIYFKRSTLYYGCWCSHSSSTSRLHSPRTACMSMPETGLGCSWKRPQERSHTRSMPPRSVSCFTIKRIQF